MSSTKGPVESLNIPAQLEGESDETYLQRVIAYTKPRNENLSKLLSEIELLKTENN